MSNNVNIKTFSDLTKNLNKLMSYNTVLLSNHIRLVQHRSYDFKNGVVLNHWSLEKERKRVAKSTVRLLSVPTLAQNIAAQ